MSDATASFTAGRRVSLARIGAALGVAGTIIGMAIFVVGCFGFSAVFALSLIPLVLGIPGLILTIVGGFRKDHGLDDPQIVASYLINIAVIAGALLEMAIWMNWTFFAGGTKTG